MRTYEWADELAAKVLPYHHEGMRRKAFEDLVRQGQDRYSNLLDALGRLGTEVSMQRVVDEDPDLPPRKFYKGAVHEFVFPPQPDSGVSRATIPIGERGHRVTRERLGREYDEELVRGHLRLSYDDSQAPPRLRLDDLLDDSELALPTEAIEAIEKAFEK